MSSVCGRGTVYVAVAPSAVQVSRRVSTTPIDAVTTASSSAQRPDLPLGVCQPSRTPSACISRLSRGRPSLFEPQVSSSPRRPPYTSASAS